MSQQAPGATRETRTATSCEWCIYGTAFWFVEYQWCDDGQIFERDLCWRCMAQLQDSEERGWVRIWLCDEA